MAPSIDEAQWREEGYVVVRDLLDRRDEILPLAMRMPSTPKVALEQQLTDRREMHIERLAEAKTTYWYSYDHVTALAICDEVPVLDQFHFNWVTTVMEKVLVALENKAEIEGDDIKKQLHRDRIAKFKHLHGIGIDVVHELREMVHEALRFDGHIGAPVRHAESLQEYADLFRAIGLPPIAADFQSDVAFADMRVVAGALLPVAEVEDELVRVRLARRLDREPVKRARPGVWQLGRRAAEQHAQARLGRRRRRGPCSRREPCLVATDSTASSGSTRSAAFRFSSSCAIERAPNTSDVTHGR